MGRPDIVNRTLGFAGSVAIALGGAAAGALPRRDPFEEWPLIRELRAFPLAGVAVTYFGLVLLCGAWLRMRSTLDGQRPADLIKTLLWWAAPLAATAPMFSRDVYSYLAQGAMVRQGLDAYRWGPSMLGGPLALDVPPIWQDTPAPYGPVFLRCASMIVAVTGEHTVAGVWAMRLVALAGVALAVACLPGLAARFGVPPQRALWFGALNPLLLLHLVAGVHNDALMVGLVAAGLLAAVRDRPLLGAALIVAAALVKAPAILALITVVALTRGRRGALIRTAAGAGLAFIVLQAASGLGLGWIAALHTPTTVRNGLSLSTDVGMLLASAGHPSAMAVIRLVAAAAGCALAGWALLRAPNPVAGLGLALAAIVLCGPVVHPWYLLWPIVPLAAGLHHPPPAAIRLSVGIAMFLLPFGAPTYPQAVVAAVFGTVGGILYLRLRPPLPTLLPTPAPATPAPATP
ncbi:polyprenol phosphomannose-dependent alpha 1,6 mannosyltransferase MptB [Dactylosporangium sp. NPDC050588]|uniref:polyprenol phosphomannose-dependent alpha 1,6 mannosyltransferase MptB n=1 Tax=Dactylosporangium sp. NPDC050588 TaxID=3157211 RepID=UPI0033BFDE02